MRVLLLLVALPTLQACLITRHVELDPPDNFPPSIADPVAPPADYRPIGSHVDLSTIEPTDDAGTLTSIHFEVAVRDPDVDQSLQYQVWINYPTPRGAALRGTIPAAAASELDRRVRRLSFDLPVASLVTCNRIELRVTTAFQFVDDQREPVTEGDLGTATWWIVDDRTVPISSCAEAP